VSPESIHYRRRWFYVLWAGLLLASLVALVLWNRPLRVEQASLQVSLEALGLPEGTQAQVWMGPRRACPRGAWDGAGAQALPMAPAGPTPLPLLRVPIARRRWVNDFIPSGTGEMVIVRLAPPGGQPARFFILTLGADIRTGALTPGRRLLVTIQVKWANLKVEVPPLNEIP